jgi:hypothetical protein
LHTPTRQGETELHILTNLPLADAPAPQISALYADRWTIEIAFQHLTVDLACEVNTLGYPKAALFGFCVALVAYKVVAVAKRLDTKKYTKHKRGPKKQPPPSSVASVIRMYLPHAFSLFEGNQCTFTGLVLIIGTERPSRFLER